MDNIQNKPRFTIITPSYNQGSYIEATICSVLNQNYPNLEYIIIDGGSTDNSINIIKKYADKLSFWVSEKDNGQSHAINKGLEHATGDIITWINSDDQLLPGALLSAANYFEQNPDVYLIHGKSHIKREKDSFIRGAIEDDLPARYLAGLPYPQPSSFFRRNTIELYGMLEEKLHYGMDYDLLMRVNLNQKVLSVPDVFSIYLMHNDSKSILANDKFAKDWAIIYCKFLRSILPKPSVYIQKLKELEIYEDNLEVYKHTLEISLDILDKSFAYFLINQVKFYFYAGNFHISKKLLDYLKSNHVEIYKKEHLSKTHLLSKPGINLLETIKRKLI